MRKLRLRNEAIYTRLNAWPGWNSGLTSYIVLKTHSTHSPRCPLVPRSPISHPSSHSPATFSVSASSCALGHTSLQPCCSPHITHLTSPLCSKLSGASHYQWMESHLCIMYSRLPTICLPCLSFSCFACLISQPHSLIVGLCKCCTCHLRALACADSSL